MFAKTPGHYSPALAAKNMPIHTSNMLYSSCVRRWRQWALGHLQVSFTIGATRDCLLRQSIEYTSCVMNYYSDVTNIGKNRKCQQLDYINLDCSFLGDEL